VTERRFPPPWSVEELEACFVVRDAPTHLIDRRTSTIDQPPDNAQDDREQDQTKNYPRPGSNFEL
jgi:hypothetical protein